MSPDRSDGRGPELAQVFFDGLVDEGDLGAKDGQVLLAGPLHLVQLLLQHLLPLQLTQSDNDYEIIISKVR